MRRLQLTLLFKTYIKKNYYLKIIYYQNYLTRRLVMYTLWKR